MGDFIKISTTVVSRAGMGDLGNTNNFYVNGRYMYEYEAGNIQVSVEKSDDEHMFAVSDGMDRTSSEKNTSISMAAELKKFQKQVKGTGGDIVSKLDQLKDKIDEVDNVIYSMSIGDSIHRQAETSAAGIFISDGKIAAVSRGRTKVFSLKDEALRVISGDENKAERLLKMGILTSEQLKELSGNTGYMGDRKKGTQKIDIENIEEGSVYLICTHSVYDSIDDEKIYEVLSSHKDTGYIANMLIKEALRNEPGSSMTAMVIRIDDPDGLQAEDSAVPRRYVKNRTKPEGSKKKESAFTFIAAAVLCMIIIGALVAVFYGQLFGNNELQAVNSVSTPADHATTVPDTGKDNLPEVQKEQTQSDSSPTQENTEPKEVRHEVVSGDTLQKISKKYYNDAQKYTIIMEANGIKDPNQLHVGDILIIPQQ